MKKMRCVLVNCDIYKIETPPIYEMENLLSTLKIDIDFVATQKLEKINTASFVGSGFLTELCNFVKCGVKDRIVDLCSGSGIIGILAQAKTNAKQVYLVEIQESLADMSRRSVEYNKLTNKLIQLNISNMSKENSI